MSEHRERWAKKPRWVRILTYTVMGLIAAVGLGILFGLVIMWLWNWLMPMLFHLPAINYWEGVGIFILAKILFGSIGGSGGSDKKAKDKKDHKARVHVVRVPEEIDEDYYDEWWEAVGKKSFDEYAEKKKEDGCGKQ